MSAYDLLTTSLTCCKWWCGLWFWFLLLIFAIDLFDLWKTLTKSSKQVRTAIQFHEAIKSSSQVRLQNTRACNYSPPTKINKPCENNEHRSSASSNPNKPKTSHASHRLSSKTQWTELIIWFGNMAGTLRARPEIALLGRAGLSKLASHDGLWSDLASPLSKRLWAGLVEWFNHFRSRIMEEALSDAFVFVGSLVGTETKTGSGDGLVARCNQRRLDAGSCILHWNDTVDCLDAHRDYKEM